MCGDTGELHLSAEEEVHVGDADGLKAAQEEEEEEEEEVAARERAHRRLPAASHPLLQHLTLALFPPPPPPLDSAILVGRGGCGCAFSWNGTVAFMGSRRFSKLTPALRPEAPLELPPLTELQLDVGEPLLRTLWDMTLTNYRKRNPQKQSVNIRQVCLRSWTLFYPSCVTPCSVPVSFCFVCTAPLRVCEAEPVPVLK